MAKRRIQLYLDGETFDQATALLGQFPGRASVSRLVDELLGDFVRVVGPVIERAKAGDANAALTMLQKSAAEMMLEVATDLAEVTDAIHTNRDPENLSTSRFLNKK